MQDLHPFFASKHFIESAAHPDYDPLQWGATLQMATPDQLDWEAADVVILGCGERRGADPGAAYSSAADAVRRQLYRLYGWHPHIAIADAGNIVQGKSVDDTRAALRVVLHELQLAGKIVILIGGSHDLTLQQYEAFKKESKVINVTVADMLIDLDETEGVTDRSYLMDMLTGEPNFVRHYTHIGFQSYYVHPRMLETLDKLRFDFMRLGKAREDIEEAEPALRGSQLFSFDMNAVRYSDAPANIQGSPNGFTGDEACTLTRYAGMGSDLQLLGLFGYNPEDDQHGMTARLMAQMIWYFIDGVSVRRMEAALTDKEQFASFHVQFTSNDTTFLKSKRTGRWWMQLPDGCYTPCAYADYLTACKDEMPERWLREQERVV